MDGSDSNDGSTWALAKATLAAALTAAGAGGRVFVDPAHAESSATSKTLTSPGTAASPVQVICVDRTGNPEPPTALSTGASVTISGANNLTITFAGTAVVYGLTFVAGSGNNNSLAFTASTGWWWRLFNCKLRVDTTHSGGRLNVGANVGSVDAQLLEMTDTQVRFAEATQTVNLACAVHWRGGGVESGGTAPTVLLTPNSQRASAILEGRCLDLSQLGSGKSLVSAAGAVYSDILFENCKLGASVGVTTGSVAGRGGVRVRLVNCDSGDTNYRYFEQKYQGTITQETTIVRTGGAGDGATPVSVKMVTTANAKSYSPLRGETIAVWNETTGSAVTATVEVVTDGVTLTDLEAWLEAEYLGTSGFPLSSAADDRASLTNLFLGSGTNQTSSSVTWTTTGLSSPTKQKLSVTFTPQEKGWLLLRVHLAKASATMYYCPKVDLT